MIWSRVKPSLGLIHEVGLWEDPLENNCTAELFLLEAGLGGSEGGSNFLGQVAFISQGNAPEKRAAMGR